MLKIATYKINRNAAQSFTKKKKMGINLGMIERKKEHPVSALDTPLRSFVVVRCSSQALSRRKEKDEVVRGRGGDTRYSRSRRRCWCRCAQIYRFPESWRRGCRRQSNWFFCPLLPRRSEFYSLAWSFSFGTPPRNTL